MTHDMIIYDARSLMCEFVPRMFPSSGQINTSNLDRSYKIRKSFDKLTSRIDKAEEEDPHPYRVIDEALAEKVKSFCEQVIKFEDHGDFTTSREVEARATTQTELCDAHQQSLDRVTRGSKRKRTDLHSGQPSKRIDRNRRPGGGPDIITSDV